MHKIVNIQMHSALADTGLHCYYNTVNISRITQKTKLLSQKSQGAYVITHNLLT